MSGFSRLLQTLGFVLLLLTLTACQKIFGEFRIDDSAFNGPIAVSPTKDLITTEWGGQATFSIVLKQEPTANVTIGLSSSNITEGLVSQASVTFTKDDWKAPQVVTVTGVDDTFHDGSKQYKVITSPAESQDPAFSGKNSDDVSLENIDNETAGITVVPRSGLVTSEGGAQDTFAVVLNSVPTRDVTVTLVSSAPTEGTVSPAKLLFTPLNANAPQIVTVTGVDDDVKDFESHYQIKLSTTSEDPNYARVAPVSVDVVNQDNESAGVSVALLSGVDPGDSNLLRTSETGDSASFSVVLNARPISMVTIAVRSDTETEGTVSPSLLTFTTENWSAPQIVTVTGIDDPEPKADGDQRYLAIVGRPQSEDADYAALSETEVPVRNVDNDKPGFTLMLLTGIDPQDPNRLITSEDGTTATFSIALNSQPSEGVTIGLSVAATREAEVSPMRLTFTKDNWNAPQVVSVTGLDDELADGSPQFYVTTGPASSEDSGYAGLDPPDVRVTNTDNDSAGLRIALVKGIDPTASNKLVTDESGTTATFTIALTSQPVADVTIPLGIAGNAKEGSLWTSSLKFTADNYGAPQTVTVEGLDDDIFDGNQPYSVSIGPAESDDTGYKGNFASQVQVTNRDDDTAGVIVNPVTGLTTSESGTTASFTVRLQSEPTADVTIAVSSNNTLEGKVNVSSLKFTKLNWKANQTVTVTGQNDDAQDGNQAYKIVLEPAKSEDKNYNNTPDPPDVSITNIDNDSAGFIVTPTSGLVTTEAGGKATFTVSLASKPVNTGNPAMSAYVKFSLSSSKPSEGAVNPSSLTFTDVNWRSPQTVTVTGVNDEVADGPQPYLIVMSLAESNDANYFAHKASDVSVTNNDDDSAGVNILPLPSPTPAITTEKSAGKSTFTVALSSFPTDDVTFSVTSTASKEGVVSPATLKFTPANGKTPQTVTVTGVNDDVADGDQQYTVRLSNGVSNDKNYAGKFGIDLPFVNVDDDHSGLDIVAAAKLKTTESGMGTATFTVALKSQPTASVSIGVSSSNTDEGKVSPTTLTFTTANWASPQTVTITGVQDEVADGTQSYQVRLADATSNDPTYDKKFGTQLDVQNVDDDAPGYTVSDVSGTKTSEKGDQVTFSVVLTSKPAGSATVTLGLSSNKVSEGTVSPSSLSFTAANWDQPHLVTVTGVDDKKADGDVGYQITFTEDPDYEAPTPAPISLTNVDDDSIGVLVNSPSCATTPGTTATFTIRLNSRPNGGSVTIALSSDTPTAAVVSPESVTFTSSGTGAWDVPQTITVTGQADGSMGMMTPYTIITGDASAPGETTGYDGYMMIPDVSCTNTTPP